MNELPKEIKIPHNVILEERKKLNISGVNDVDSFDDETITAYTEMGELTIKGNNLHIIKLSTETGELAVEGKIRALFYNEETGSKSGNVFSRIFR